MDIAFIDLKKQYRAIQDEIDAKIHDVITESAFIGGKYVRNFEHQFARFCNAQHCVGVGNGTDALYIALRRLGIGAGDEVITAANSFIATSLRRLRPSGTSRFGFSSCVSIRCKNPQLTDVSGTGKRSN